ncbi:MAG: sigma 54-interacting transcriptional regulator [Gammaproteobacteria bacterium]
MSDSSSPDSRSLGFGILPRTIAARSQSGDRHAKPRKAYILLVDGDPEMRQLMSARLRAAGYDVDTANDASAALDSCVKSRPNLVITDLKLQQMSGLAFLKELKSRWPEMTVIILTAHGTIPEAVEATQSGAFGFLVKPVDKVEMLGQVQRAIAASSFTTSGGDWREQIVSRSRLMQERLGEANWAAGSDAPVMLTGENGTGKELLARAIHAASARRAKPFVVVNCRDLVEAALEFELFGQTGNTTMQPTGAINAARGGTLLLHEIGDLPFPLQLKLVEAMRGNPIASGQSDPRCTESVRLICATSCDLKKLMNSGKFAQHLYYEINILPIEIPPLGRRREDIPLLVSHFLEQATEIGSGEKIYTPQAMELLATADWPGNVRQLFDLVKKNVALAEGKVMTEAFVQQSMGGEPVRAPTYEEARNAFSHEYLTNSLEQTEGNITQSARIAKRNRTDFYKLLARHRIHADDFKNAATAKSPRTRD